MVIFVLLIALIAGGASGWSFVTSYTAEVGPALAVFNFAAYLELRAWSVASLWVRDTLESSAPEYASRHSEFDHVPEADQFRREVPDLRRDLARSSNWPWGYLTDVTEERAEWVSLFLDTLRGVGRRGTAREWARRVAGRLGRRVRRESGRYCGNAWQALAAEFGSCGRGSHRRWRVPTSWPERKRSTRRPLRDRGEFVPG